jgi:outer membrane autotransporter protein
MDGWQANAYLERGLILCRQGWDVRPYGALQYVYLRQNNLVESGPGSLNLAVGGLDVHSLRSILGGRISREVSTSGGRRLTPEIRAAWLHEFLDTNQVVSAGLADVGGAGFAVRGVDLGRDWASVGGALHLQANASTRWFASYDVQFNEHQTFHIGAGGVEVVW